MNKNEKIDYEKILDDMGFNGLDSLDKEIINILFYGAALNNFFKNYPNFKTSYLMNSEQTSLIFIMEMFKHQLKTNIKCDKLIEQNDKLVEQNEILQQQNNQIIELLQKIADK